MGPQRGMWGKGSFYGRNYICALVGKFQERVQHEQCGREGGPLRDQAALSA